LHLAEGWVLFMFALGMLVGFHRALNWMYRAVRRAP
jgi:hypothetical protein